MDTLPTLLARAEHTHDNEDEHSKKLDLEVSCQNLSLCSVHQYN
jgi:hypothetical protein